MGYFEADYFVAKQIKDDIILSVTKNYLEGGKATARSLKKDSVAPKKENIMQISEIVAESIKGVTADMSKRIRIEIRESILQGETKEELKRRLDNIFKGDNPTRFRYEQRLDTIARTETTRALSQGGLDTAFELGATSKWLLMVNDSRTSDVSKAFHKKYGSAAQAIPIREEFIAMVGGKEYRGMTTPLHINDRDTVMYEFGTEVKGEGHKYIKRTGGPGNYRYEYAEEEVSKKVQDDVTDKEKRESFTGGDCYSCSAKKLMELNAKGKDKGWKLVHGTAIGQGKIAGIPHGHSWLEKDGMVYDYSNNRSIVINKEVYYAIGKISNTQKYTATQMQKKISTTGTWGPWDSGGMSSGELKLHVKESVKKHKSHIHRALSKVPKHKIKKLEDRYQKSLSGDDTHGKYKVDGKWTEDRKKVHDPIFKGYIGAVEMAKDKNPDVVFMAGIPGSGKTYNTKKLFTYSADGLTAKSKETGKTYLLIAGDDIKAKLPEYEGGDGASLVHEESSSLSKDVMALAIREKANVIYDGTSSNSSNTLHKVRSFTDAGYKAQAIFVDTPVEDAIFNSATRYRDTGRFMHPEVIAEAEPAVRNTMNKLKDKFYKVNHIKVTKRDLDWDKI